jgi:hypothetical protein
LNIDGRKSVFSSLLLTELLLLLLCADVYIVSSGRIAAATESDAGGDILVMKFCLLQLLLVQPLRPSRDVITVFPSLFVNKCV